jgi:glutathione S-transferase
MPEDGTDRRLTMLYNPFCDPSRRTLQAFNFSLYIPPNYEMSSPKSPNITLYITQTPNGNKASILLEELGIPYRVYKHDFAARTHKEPWYLKINPNGKIPAITDVFSDGKEIHIWESGNVLKYLVEQYDPTFKLWYPHGTRENYELFSWVSLFERIP